MTGLEAMNQPRDPNDIDLVFQVGHHLEYTISKEVADKFRNDLSILTVKDSTPVVQRVIINRYFCNMLLQFRAEYNIPVNNILAMLVSDGYAEDWFKLFITYVAPFLKENQVIERMCQN